MGDASRRDILKLSTAALAALIFRARPARAQVVEAIAIIGFSLQVLSFLMRGKSTGNLTALTFQAILEISKQLSAINEKLNVVLSDLDFIKKRLEVLPSEVVEALRKDAIVTAATRFAEETRTYQLERLNSGGSDDRARKTVEGAVRDRVIEPIREARSSLVSHFEPDFTPFLARGLAIESQAAALIADNTSRQRAALETYRGWFAKMLEPDFRQGYERRIGLLNEEVEKNDPATWQRNSQYISCIHKREDAKLLGRGEGSRLEIKGVKISYGGASYKHQIHFYTAGDLKDYMAGQLKLPHDVSADIVRLVDSLSDDERRAYLPIVYTNTFDGMVTEGEFGYYFDGSMKFDPSGIIISKTHDAELEKEIAWLLYNNLFDKQKLCDSKEFKDEVSKWQRDTEANFKIWGMQRFELFAMKSIATRCVEYCNVRLGALEGAK